jgi:DNA-binding NarL/FixJ family response regulator
VKTANEWIDDAKNRPVPKKLFGDLLIQNEMCIFFGPTGEGKTVLAVQIVESIASGKAIPGFELGVGGQKVLYLDCELSDKQFEGRYASKVPDSDYYAKHYRFSDNFLRAEIDLSTANIDSPAEFQDELQRSIGFAIAEKEVDTVVVDNISWLRDETEKARAALPLMKGLVDLKRRFNVSILVLAHTPKRDLSQAITLNHLQGSAVLANFADSIFAIGKSTKDAGMRYIKQLKVRSGEIVYTADNVKTCQLVKNDNFLHFEFGEETPESVHLKQMSEDDLVDRRQSIDELHRKGRSQRDIARELGLSVSTVNKYVKKIEDKRSPRSCSSHPERTNEQDQNSQNRTYSPKNQAEGVRSFAPYVNSVDDEDGTNKGEQGRTSRERCLCECGTMGHLGLVCDSCGKVVTDPCAEAQI